MFEIINVVLGILILELFKFILLIIMFGDIFV